MSFQELISAEIGRASGRPFNVRSGREAGGGCIHRALVLEGDGTKWFVKLNKADALPMFEAESDGLAALADADAFRVPRPLCAGVIGDQAYLVLEHLDLQPVGERSGDRRKSQWDAIAFGHALAALHRKSGLCYGWKRDNFIGATPQINMESESWPRFFAATRLLPQVKRAAAHGRELQEKGALLAEKLPAFFLDYRPQPSLLHGDLWHGNAAMCSGMPAIFDPAVYHGDREADLAMTELFGGFPEAFYAAYREAWPLAEGYESRKTLYNLYHVLNHLNLFGAGYLRQAERMVDRLLAELRG
ncbi:MAG: fructosamine kinase family protein [Betaproteobacteria bacterium]|nr:fructosamine kinase family protein [Betaproteobacteria bacterium]